MAGWANGHGKSNNAVAAEQNGKVTKSKITTRLLRDHGISDFTAADIKKLIDNSIISTSEWHHTNSTFYHCTDYFDIEGMAIDISDDPAYFKRELKKIKEREKEEKEDILYAEIEVTFVENTGSKRHPRWAIEKNNYIAKVKNYNLDKKFVMIKTAGGSEIRKTHQYVSIVRDSTLEEFEKEAAKLTKQKEKERLNFIKEQLFTNFKNLNDEDILLKIKRSRTVKSLKKLEAIAAEKLEQEEKEVKEKLMERFKDIDINDWLSLPKQEKHPAPKHICDMKVQSGLGWADFEALAAETEIKLSA